MRLAPLLRWTFAASLVACGGGAPSPAPPAPAASAPKQAAAGPDLTPVPAPPNLSIVLTVKNAAALQKDVRAVAGSVFPMLQSITADAAARTLLGTALADVVDLSKRIDVGFLDSSSVFAVSLTLTSIDDARQNLVEDFDLAPRDDGAIALAPHKGAEGSRLRCEIRPAAGDAPYRLVCAYGTATLRALGPYLARTVARETVADDVKVSIVPTALSVSFDRLDATKPGEAGLRKAIVGAFAELDALSLRATLGADPLVASLEATFRGSTSSVTRLLLAETQDPKPIPDLFWRLPADSLGAVYARGAAPDDLAPVKDWLETDMEASSRQSGASDEYLARTRAIVSSVFFTGGPFAAAYGFDVSGAIKAIESATIEHRVERSAFHGWLAVGVEEPASRWTDAMRAVMALDRIPWRAPGGTVRAAREPTVTRASEEPVSDAKLPPRTAHFVFRQIPIAKGGTKGKTGGAGDKRKNGNADDWAFHVYIVPDGARTWLMLGANDAQVLAKTHEVLSSTPGTGLAGRADLGALHMPAAFAGFVSAGVIDALRGPDDAADPTRARVLFDTLSASQDVEATPVVFLVPGSAGPAGHIELRALAPKDAAKTLLSRTR